MLFTQKINESDVEFEIKLATDTSHKNFTELIENFCKGTPNTFEIERSNLKNAGIITVAQRWAGSSSVIIINHGANSLAGTLKQQEEQKKLAAQKEEKRKEQEEVTQAARIYFIKRCCAVGLSLAAIIGLLYYKFSTNNQKLI